MGSSSTKAECSSLRTRCVFDLVSSDQLTEANIKRYVPLQTSLIDHALTLSPQEQKVALKKVLSESTQFGRLMREKTDGKDQSFKREHGQLFRALAAYAGLATDEDADFTFELATTLNNLIKNHEKRSPAVLSVLITLLRKSLSRYKSNDARITDIEALLMPVDPKEVSLRSLVFNAYSEELTGEYLTLLEDLLKRGMPANEMERLLYNPMITWIGSVGRITDLVAYLADTTASVGLATRLEGIIVSCSAEHGLAVGLEPVINILLSEKTLSIGNVWSTRNKPSLLELLKRRFVSTSLKEATRIRPEPILLLPTVAPVKRVRKEAEKKEKAVPERKAETRERKEAARAPKPAPVPAPKDERVITPLQPTYYPALSTSTSQAHYMAPPREMAPQPSNPLASMNPSTNPFMRSSLPPQPSGYPPVYQTAPSFMYFTTSQPAAPSAPTMTFVPTPQQQSAVFIADPSVIPNVSQPIVLQTELMTTAQIRAVLGESAVVIPQPGPNLDGLAETIATQIATMTTRRRTTMEMLASTAITPPDSPYRADLDSNEFQQQLSDLPVMHRERRERNEATPPSVRKLGSPAQ